MCASASLSTVVSADFLSDEAREYLADFAGPGGAPVRLLWFDKAAYTEICEKAGAIPGSAVILNYTELDRQGRNIEFFPYRFSDKTFTLSGPAGSYRLNVSAQLSEPTPLLSTMYNPEVVNIIVPGNIMEEFGLDLRVIWFSTASSPIDFFSYADSRLAEYAGKYRMDNIAEASSMAKNLFIFVRILVYGFIAMLSLIGITSVMSTISTNIKLRAQEFAMLSSVGLTPAGLRKMLNLESLLYGFKSLAIGLPLGLVLSYMLYLLFGLLAEFSFEIPWQSMGICVTGVSVVTFVSMRYAAHKIRGSSIVETIRVATV
jgi:putative ABC transport system permease protein